MSKPRRGRVFLKALCIFGLMSLSFLLGALVICLRLPPAKFIADAYVGIHTYLQRTAESDQELRKRPTRSSARQETVDVPGQTYDGYTIYIQGPREPLVTLIDMKGNVVHEWNSTFSKVWEGRDQSHLDGVADDAKITPFFGHLFPNGDLLVTYHSLGNGVLFGCGMAKLDKDSQTIWVYSGNCHHDLDVGEDGRVYGVRLRPVRRPLQGLEYMACPCMVDDLVVLSADGQLERVVPIIETIRDSPYGAMLAAQELSHIEGVQQPTNFMLDIRRRDLMHTNHVEVLSKAKAPKFPMFKAGQIMLSMRHLDMICVFDIDREKPQCVWAARGPWNEQHDPEFLDNGRILLFDNRPGESASRVMEFDPATQAMPWCFWGGKDHPLCTFERGDSQRLPNGNTFIASTHGRVMIEVTPDKTVVWQQLVKLDLFYARRYGTNELTFVDEKRHPPR